MARATTFCLCVFVKYLQYYQIGINKVKKKANNLCVCKITIYYCCPSGLPPGTSKAMLFPLSNI
jgi:hypothetical protein